MNELYNLTFTTTNIICLGITAALVFVIPIILWLLWHRSHKGQVKLA